MVNPHSGVLHRRNGRRHAAGAALLRWRPTASFTLVNVPDGAGTLSAKTAWNLRSNVSLGGGTDNQWTATLTGADKLLGGDINNTNSINILDYSKLKIELGRFDRRRHKRRRLNGVLGLHHHADQLVQDW